MVPEAPGLPLAFAAGVVSFVSPCVLPLVPGYLAAVTGSATRPTSGLDGAALARSLVFVGTFSAIFMALGLSATALGSFLFDHQPTMRRIAGVVIAVMGIVFVASPFVDRLNRSWHPASLSERAGAGGPLLAGAAFALAWTPCVGPTLGAILGLAATSEGTASAALLLGSYSAGLAVPFLASAAAFRSAQRVFDALRRHYGAIRAVAGVILVVMGVLVFTGELFRLNIEIQKLLDGLGINFFQDV